MKATGTTRELHCEDCDRDYPVWVTPSDLWNKVVRVPSEGAGVVEPFLCLTCFALRAERGAVVPTAWIVRPERDEDMPGPQPETLQAAWWRGQRYGLVRAMSEARIRGHEDLAARIELMAKVDMHSHPDGVREGDWDLDDANHSRHGREAPGGGPEDPDCPCRKGPNEKACALTGCGFCNASPVGWCRLDGECSTASTSCNNCHRMAQRGANPSLRPVYTQAEWDEREERFEAQLGALGEKRPEKGS